MTALRNLTTLLADLTRDPRCMRCDSERMAHTDRINHARGGCVA